MNRNSTISLWLRSICVTALVAGIAILPAFLSSCKEELGPTTTPGGGANTVTVRGIVYAKRGSADRQVLSGALVSVRSPFFNRDTLTSSQGAFTFVIGLPDTLTSSSNATVSFSKAPDYQPQSVQVILRGGLEIPVDFTLTSTDTTVLPPTSGPAASVVYLGSTSASASVKGGGAIQSVTFNYEVRDSAGVPVDSLHRTKVYFALKPAINGGEKLSVVEAMPSTGIDRRGRVSTTLLTGTVAGIVQVEASIKTPVATKVTSTAVPIFGGAPSADHFSMTVEKANFPALLVNGVTDHITVQLGDKYSNPVPSGTPVYFSSTTGIIQSMDTTNQDGKAAVNLISGDPRPSRGMAWVYAQTVGDSGLIIKDSLSVFVTGETYIAPADTDIYMANRDNVTIAYRVYDKQWAHPLAAGTHIVVTVTGEAASELLVTGDADVTLPDTRDDNFTYFGVTLKDTANIVPDPDKSFVMTITVTSPNGNLTRSYQGLLHGSGGGGVGPNTKIGSLVLASISDNQISVKGTGSNQTATVTFLALDRSGKPVARDSSALVNFRLVPASLGATIFPTSGNTDAQGRVQAVLSSGTKSGVIQIQAYADTGAGGQVFSAPVPITIASGLPSPAHFTIAVARFNVPGLHRAGEQDAVTVYVGDINGNPVQPNTAVYFATNGGIVNPSVYTNANGIASTMLTSSNPNPPNGVATITSTTISDSSRSIVNTAQVIFSGYPTIDVSPNDSIVIGDGMTAAVSYSVHDEYNHPMAAGTSITATLLGTKTERVVMTGDLSTNLGDHFSGGAGVTSFVLSIQDTALYNLEDQYLTLRLSSSGPNGSVYRDMPIILKHTTDPPNSIVKNVVITDIDQRRLTVIGTGQLDSTMVHFEIQDQNGNPLRLKNKIITPGFSGALGNFSKGSILTDSTGHANVTFKTGADTGTCSIYGIVGQVKSAPQDITILPGKASRSYFNVYATRPPDTLRKVNFPGMVSVNQKMGVVNVVVKDRYNHPVAPGTRVDLSSNAGLLQPSIGYTDRDGMVKADWFGGSPLPAGGNASITASIRGELDSLITKSHAFIYSGGPVISNFAAAIPAVLNHGMSLSVDFTLLDGNGHPVAEGESVKVSLSGTAASSIKMDGNVFARMVDTDDPNKAKFQIKLTDTSTTVYDQRSLTIRIEADGPGGKATPVEYNGSLKGAPPLPFAILTNTIDNNSIYVTNSIGLVKTSNLTFQIQDSSHKNVLVKGVDIQFIHNSLGGSLSAQHGLTDDSGRVSVTFSSGVFAETVTVYGVSSGISSTPQKIVIQPGLPSPAYFSLALLGTDAKPKVNFPGMFNTRNPLGSAKVRVRDQYGNIVKSGTNVRFTSNAGTVQGFGYTDRDGFAEVTWSGGPNFPPNGAAYVKAQAFDANGAQLAYDSLAVLYTGQAVIAGGLPNNFVFHQGIDTTVTFTVRDGNGNPIAAGSTIQVSLSGTGASTVNLTGNVNVTTTDTRDVNSTTYSVHLTDVNTVEINTRSLTMQIDVSGPNGTATKSVSGALKGAPVMSVFSLALVNISAPVLSVKGGDGIESSLLTYELRDSLNRPLLRDSVVVAFSNQGASGSFSAASAMTDAMGRVQVQFLSGTQAGIARITAAAGAVTNNSLKVTITGGKPDQSHFTFILGKDANSGLTKNYPGEMPVVQQIGVAQVQLGDQYGNPVPAGTPVYFTTNAGVIQGSAATDSNGFAKVDWYGGKPFPLGGNARVKASALGTGGTVVADSLTVVYSGQALISGGLPSNYQLKAGIDTTFTYSAVDANGNPIAQGAQIKVSASGTGASSLILMGDVNVTMGDAAALSGATFSVRIVDTNSTVTTTRPVTLNFDVTGPNGSYNKQVSATLKGITVASTTYPRIAGLGLVAVSDAQLTVKDAGGVDVSLLTYELRDSVNNPILEPGVKVTFTHSGVPGTFGTDTVLTNANGRAQVQFYSDTLAGIAQVQGSVAGTAVVSPQAQVAVVGGLPSPSHFTFILSRTSGGGTNVNYPGAIQIVQVIGYGQVEAGDKYGNPVPKGTTIYFATNAGVIQGSATTDENGYASVNWFSGNPVPTTEQAVVSASAVGLGGTFTVSKTVVYSSAVQLTGGPSTGFVISGGGTATYSYQVADMIGLPVAEGTTITVTASDAASSSIVLTGNVNVSVGDETAASKTHYSFTVTDTSSTSTTVRPLTLTITVSGPNGSASSTVTGSVLPVGVAIPTTKPRR